MNEDQIIDAAEREMDIYRNEVTRITAERDKLRDALSVVLDQFAKGSDGYHARISQVNLARAYKAAGVLIPAELERFL